jgi:hypothetical protein
MRNLVPVMTYPHATTGELSIATAKTSNVRPEEEDRRAGEKKVNPP